MTTTQTKCKDCGADIWQQPDKALDGTYAVVWMSAQDGGWICRETGDEHVPAEDDDAETPMDPAEALTYAILAINTDQAPDATSGNDLLYLECNAERAIAALDRIRDFVIASGEDLPDYVFGKDES